MRSREQELRRNQAEVDKVIIDLAASIALEENQPKKRELVWYLRNYLDTAKTLSEMVEGIGGTDDQSK